MFHSDTWSPLLSNEEDQEEIDLLFTVSVLQSYFAPAAVETRTTWLVISSSEPNLGLDRDDEELSSLQENVVTRVAPRDAATQVASRRRLTDTDASNGSSRQYIPSQCLEQAFRDQRVGASCAGALHQLEAIRAYKADKLVLYYEGSNRGMKNVVSIYSLAMLMMLLLISAKLKRRSPELRDTVLEPTECGCCCGSCYCGNDPCCEVRTFFDCCCENNCVEGKTRLSNAAAIHQKNMVIYEGVPIQIV
jgi:hypothetical protein